MEGTHTDIPDTSGSAKPPQLSDVAAIAQVSVGLASRVLRGDSTLRARPETRERVLNAAALLQYTPHRSAQALRGQSTGTFGLVVHDIGNPIYAEIIKGAQDAASAAGFGLFLADADDISARDAAYQSLVAPGRVDGLLLQAGGYERDEALTSALKSRRPLVLVNSTSPLEVPAVHMDNEAAARLAAAHLLDAGHRDIAFVGGWMGSPTSSARVAGLTSAMREAGLPAPLEFDAGWDMAAGRRAMANIAESAVLPTALLVSNTFVAVGVLTEARLRGIAIPGDLSVIAFHDVWLAEAAYPALTVVSTPLREMGTIAVDALVRLTQGFEVGSTCVTSPGLHIVLRSSTGPPRTRQRQI
ncbi:LacI family transcriptional regulator [Nakamurella antarctica]|uniref:LacI family transcriptional regulator n=1 Tax=Nakamurella antarctica TaxID=1902245 RepID=A0A3G8ZJI0_9ACTN|nr:LacI family DNA-binding transcriptional regulator [Nakamurella antarctica]AZI56927.1 LacI family transcriptional regulator [Nakamurella antarctica]